VTVIFEEKLISENNVNLMYLYHVTKSVTKSVTKITKSVTDFVTTLYIKSVTDFVTMSQNYFDL